MRVARHPIGLGLAVAVTLAGGTATLRAQPGDDDSGGAPPRPVVTNAEVKQFLDPIVVINRFTYGFSTNVLPGDNRIYTNRVRPFWAVNARNAAWVDLPALSFGGDLSALSTGLGDVAVGWGHLLHEDLESRFTTSFVTFEALAPTGDPARLTGLGTWMASVGGGAAFNPTDVFPVYVTGRYLHSMESLGGHQRPDEVEDRPEIKVRSVELSAQTVHILPKGFFISAVPTVVLNLEQSFNLFSLGLGGGRAITRNVAVSGAYVHHIAGERTFNRAFSVSVQFVFGQRKDRPPPPPG